MKKTQRSEKEKKRAGSGSFPVRKKLSNGVYLFILIVLFAISTGISYLYFEPIFAFKSSFIEDIGAKRLKARHENRKGGSPRLYKSNGQAPSISYNAEFRKDSVLVVAENVIRKHVKRYNVELLDLYMDKEGVIYIDLSNELRKNFKGDAFEEYSIIAGLYRKLKASVSNFKALKILIEGKEAESFGGHIDISKPIGEEIADNI